MEFTVPETHTTPLLQMTAIEKSFPGVRALSGVDLTLQRGEVLALMGENGAGKSTLIKMLGGAHQPDAGEISIEGTPVSLSDPAAAMQAGIGVIYQEFNLIPALNAWENIFLGRERSGFFVAKTDERRRAAELFQRLGVDIPLDVPARQLSVAQQQLVEIAKALSQNARILVMDEPSAALLPQEVQKLFAIIRDLKAQGIGIIYISHRLDEIFDIADSITVLRDGQYVGHAPSAEMTRQQMIEMMVGRSIENEFPKRPATIGDVRLEVSHLSRGTAVRDISFGVRRGEVLGLTGLVGAGRTELVRLIFGADKAEAGELTLDGKPLRIGSPRDAIKAGICLLTEDRKSQGLVLGLSVRENFGLPNLSEFSQFGMVSRRNERDALTGYVDSLSIRISHDEQLAKNLSGGNQQKVVLAKWLQQNAEILIFDEPTRGIDVGAKHEIYQLMNRLASAGKAIIMISSELPEVIGMSDRILVMHEGRLTGEVTDVTQVTQEQIMELAIN
ncbi:Ribose import ATP-binding protein RbsA [Fuerstiella marisgermanici]|uniref:Ribose import ATP-binding protein RbsA n=1 Tax=Fuerstiella marisgermanici TaxID=1891926 RepID=A0A1P8WL91_9PLAN|nr:Ribose import ATP-binding protein RbsA [Fuerstiella marisgermanici]